MIAEEMAGYVVVGIIIIIIVVVGALYLGGI